MSSPPLKKCRVAHISSPAPPSSGVMSKRDADVQQETDGRVVGEEYPTTKLVLPVLASFE